MATGGMRIRVRTIITPLFWVALLICKARLFLVFTLKKSTKTSIEYTPVLRSIQYKDRLFVFANWIKLKISKA